MCSGTLCCKIVQIDKVVNPLNKEWGIGQVQSIIKDKVTVNFENVGKKVINAKNIGLKKIDD